MKHIFFNCKIEKTAEVNLYSKGQSLLNILKKICSTNGLTFQKGSYIDFVPIGATAFCILSESHFSIHTWPEKGILAIDLFSCSNLDNKIINKISKELKLFLNLEEIEIVINEREL